LSERGKGGRGDSGSPAWPETPGQETTGLSSGSQPRSHNQSRDAVTYVALAESVALLLTVLGFLTHLRALDRAHDRRVDLLTDKVLHLAGRTWTPPPHEELVAVPDLDLIDPDQEPGY
jgi:hypothetical protein